MRTQRLLICLTAVNLGLLLYQQSQLRPSQAAGITPVLRGRALEIIDNQGRVRASLSVLPENPDFKTTNGKPYPETVILRLITSHGGPNVKLAATEQGSGLVLGGESDPTYIQAKAEGAQSTFLKLINKYGERVIKP